MFDVILFAIFFASAGLFFGIKTERYHFSHHLQQECNRLLAKARNDWNDSGIEELEYYGRIRTLSSVRDFLDSEKSS